MRPLFTIVFATFLLITAVAFGVTADAQAEAAAAVGAEAEPATEGITPAPEGEEVIAEDAITDENAVEGLLTYDASEVDLDDFLWVKRLIVIFANTPADPLFEQQRREIAERADEMASRDVVVVIDTDPNARSQARTRLRPRGFMLAIIDKDGEVKQRRPAPRTGRELIAVIDRFPSRRQEMLEQRPSGRD